MGNPYENRLSVSVDELYFNAENSGINNRGRMGRRNYTANDTVVYKSKNLETERRRRQKLSDRLLMLRSLMNKATIIEDAITYIKNLKDKVDSLTLELQEIEATSETVVEPKTNETNNGEDMKEWGIKEEVRVTNIDGKKLWLKMIMEKKKGRLTQLMDGINSFGIELIDTNITTMKGALLITASIQGMDGEALVVQQTKELMLDIINSTHTY
ncbi:hypothetical protein PIB30_043510 [Stylosanthes scabra]|uniref:BHLH domain-containing protein n=1 Tax=Stylosanthes scabra TaxID=79078 RepID=A0ABU6SGK6_9FABA|nr:hypothetical protein [Stylosanthes scabra]